MPDRSTPDQLAETVRNGAHFYMGHKMREWTTDEGIAMAEHVPGEQTCPACVAEAALADLLALAKQGEAERDEAWQAGKVAGRIAAKREYAAVLAHLQSLYPGGERTVETIRGPFTVELGHVPVEALTACQAELDKANVRKEELWSRLLGMEDNFTMAVHRAEAAEAERDRLAKRLRSFDEADSFADMEDMRAERDRLGILLAASVPSEDFDSLRADRDRLAAALEPLIDAALRVMPFDIPGAHPNLIALRNVALAAREALNPGNDDG